MVFITAEIFSENCIYTIKRQIKDETTVLWIRIKDLNEKLDKFKDRPTKEQIQKYKKYGLEFIEGF